MKQDYVDLTVITATCDRPSALANCLRSFQNQSLGGLRCEHIVVSDVVDLHARELAHSAGARYFELPEPVGQWGAGAKDFGIAQACGEYVCFWDDDNVYETHALISSFSAAHQSDIGVVHVHHRLRKRPGMVTIPRRWEGRFVRGDIDTMSICVKRSLACLEKWQSQNPQIFNDYEWLMKLMQHQPKIRFLPVIIGQHV